MNDTQVLSAIDKAKRSYRASETKARNAFQKAKARALSFYGDSDVERAARHNEIRRAELVYEAADAKARIAYIDRLEDIRVRAGEWADLVPRVSR